MKRTEIRELAFKLIYSLEIQKNVNLEMANLIENDDDNINNEKDEEIYDDYGIASFGGDADDGRACKT